MTPMKANDKTMKNKPTPGTRRKVRLHFGWADGCHLSFLLGPRVWARIQAGGQYSTKTWFWYEGRLQAFISFHEGQVYIESDDGDVILPGEPLSRLVVEWVDVPVKKKVVKGRVRKE